MTYTKVCLDNSNINVLSNNTVTNNSEGLYLTGSNNNPIYTNTLSGNTWEQAWDNGTNSYDNGTNGNYYSDYSGSGTYPINGGSNVDNHPNIVPLLFSGNNTQLDPFFVPVWSN